MDARARSTWKVRLGIAVLLVAAALFVALTVRLNLPVVDLVGSNVVLIVADALRADHLGCYGYAEPTSPFIDALAARSVVFDNVTSPSSQTVPSVISLLSGVYPRRHGNQYYPVFDSFGVPRRGVAPRIPDDLPLLAERMASAGYRTAAVVTNPWLRTDYGFGRGFETYHYLTEAGRGPYTDGARVNMLAGQLLADLRGERFFLYLHYMDTHAPYVPPAQYGQLFGAGHAGAKPLRDNGPAPDASARDVDLSRAMYDAEIRGFDDLVAGVFRDLEAFGLADHTLVVVTGDHGEEFHEHQGLGHGWTLFEEVIRPPLLFSHPELELVAGRVGKPISLVDLPATLVELTTGLQIDSEGESFARWVMDPAATVRYPERRVYSELGSVKTVRGARFKLIRFLSGGDERVFDLSADRRELEPIDPAASVAARLRADLDEFMAEAVAEPAPGVDQLVDPETTERLRALGYGD